MRLGAVAVNAALLIASAMPAALAQDYSEALNPKAVRSIDPPIGVRATAAAGSPMVADVSQLSVEGARLEVGVEMPAATKISTPFPAGSALFRIKSSRAFKACGVVNNERGFPSCLIDDDGDGLFDRAAKNSVTDGQPLASPARYRRITDLRLPGMAGGLERALLYQGATADGIKISYREFQNGLARDAFTEELSIPLSKSFPQRFAAKGLVFTAYSLDGMGLTYSIDRVAGW